MKIKKEYLVLIALIVALSLYLILRNPDRGQYELPQIPAITEADLSKIEIAKLDTSLVLAKKDSKWNIAPERYPADDQKVKGMLDIIETLTLTALVSESKNYNRYQLDNDTKITVKAWAGEALKREFEVGKPAPSYRHTFVKLAGDHRVYHAQENFTARFNVTTDQLADKTVLSFDHADIQEIRMVKGDQEAVFGREQAPVEVSTSEKAETPPTPPPPPKAETVWRTTDGKEADGSKLNSVLTTTSRLRCENYIEGKTKSDFTDPLYTLRLAGPEEYTLSIFAKEDKDAKSYPALSSRSDFPFLLSAKQAEKIMKDPGDMIKKPPQPPSTPQKEGEKK